MRVQSEFMASVDARRGAARPALAVRGYPAAGRAGTEGVLRDARVPAGGGAACRSIAGVGMTRPAAPEREATMSSLELGRVEQCLRQLSVDLSSDAKDRSLKSALDAIVSVLKAQDREIETLRDKIKSNSG